MLTTKNAVPVPRYENFTPRSLRTSQVGSSNRRQDTTPEIMLRTAMSTLGLRYRSNVRTLPGCPDLVLSRPRIAIFCDGDFWHGRQWQKRKRQLKAGWNAQYWVAKIERNRARDRAVARALRQLGWCVIRVWEGDIRRDSLRVAQNILKSARTRSASLP